MNYISKNFVLFTTMKKILEIRNTYLYFFVLKKEFFETSFCRIFHRGVIYGYSWGKKGMNKFINA